MDDLLTEFLAETRESLTELDLALVAFEQNPQDRATLSLIFRQVHTIKGTCGFLGLARLERVAHAAENVLGRVREGSMQASPATITPVLAALDAIKAIVAALSETGLEPDGDDGAVIAALDRLDPASSKDESDISVDPPPDTTREPAQSAAPEPARTADAAAAAQTVRVGVDALESLMTLVGELVLTRNEMLQLSRGRADDALAGALQRLSHLTSELQEGVMRTRMQPVGTAWNKLPRLVRDLGQELDKRIELVMHGAETELDRQVLELIRDPLTHMVRNSGDHGLEGPAERRAAGKPETGRIALSAWHEGGHVVVEIADDGRGLDAARIRAKALSLGLAGEAELAGMDASEIHRFIFAAGFSTADAVTSVSGRGVGMDVVRANIERIGGTIDLASVPGAGTTVTVRIPLTLAIIAALIVEAAGARFAVPQAGVVELVQAVDGLAAGSGRPTIDRIAGTPVLRLRDRLLPLVHLDDQLRLPGARSGDGERCVVVVAVGTLSYGIVVDRVFDAEEIVVKPVAPVLRQIPLYGGNTILGDGAVVMILDPGGLARMSGIFSATRRAESVAPPPPHSAQATPLLLFRAGEGAPKAVPLGLVARIERLDRGRIERSSAGWVTRYRDTLMPLLPFVAEASPRDPQPALVFADRNRRMGLMVDEIIDVTDAILRVEIASGTPGVLGTAIVGERAVDVIATEHWLTRAWPDWFSDRHDGAPGGKRLLLVEDSDFFRRMLVPSLAAAGYSVSVASDGEEALALRDAGLAFDAIVSDIEMPRMDGLELIRRLRQPGGPASWRRLPVIALTSRDGPAERAEGQLAGFDAYLGKAEHASLLAALDRCLAHGAA